MIYKWKVPGIIPVDAQTAGEELTRIYDRYGALEPQTIVNESRPESAPLHDCFEWRDEVAAEKYRQQQAANIVRAIVITESEEQKPKEGVRAFVRSTESYEPIQVTVSDTDKMTVLLQSALRELAAFRRKYQMLSELAPIFESIEKLSA